MQTPLEVDQHGVLRRYADKAPLLIGHDARMIFLAESSQRRIGGQRIGRGERGAKRVQLHQLGVAELAGEQCGAALTEQIDRCRLADENDRQQQEREPAEQRARPERQPQAPASLDVAGSSGTNT